MMTKLGLAAVLFTLVGCGADGSAPAPLEQRAITGVDGQPLPVDVLELSEAAGRLDAHVRAGGRSFALRYKADAHGVTAEVTGDDGARYQLLLDGAGRATFSLRDAGGESTVAVGSEVIAVDRRVDPIAASLLQSLWTGEWSPIAARGAKGSRAIECEIVDNANRCWLGFRCIFTCDQPGVGVGGCADWRLVTCRYVGF